jgi:hypothetical protein
MYVITYCSACCLLTYIISMRYYSSGERRYSSGALPKKYVHVRCIVLYCMSMFVIIYVICLLPCMSFGFQ